MLKVFVFRAYKVLSKAGTLININDILERETNLYLKSIISNIDTKGVSVKMISAKGGTIESIQSVKSELGIDLIVVGPRSNSIREEVVFREYFREYCKTNRYTSFNSPRKL